MPELLGRSGLSLLFSLMSYGEGNNNDNQVPKLTEKLRSSKLIAYSLSFIPIRHHGRYSEFLLCPVLVSQSV